MKLTQQIRTKKNMLYLENNKNWRCPVCLREFAMAEYYNKPACTVCGARNPLLYIPHDITLKLNWQDLRILAIYSVRFARMFANTDQDNYNRKALENILEKINAYRPKHNAIPLLAEIEAEDAAKRISEKMDQMPPPPAQKKHVSLVEITESQRQDLINKKDESGNVVSPFFRKS